MTTAEEIYNLYPRHVGKKEAIRSIEKALGRLFKETGNGVGWLKGKVQRFANSPAGNRGIYTPYPATWFNQSRYLDDEAEWELMTEKEEANMRRYREVNVGVWKPQ